MTAGQDDPGILDPHRWVRDRDPAIVQLSVDVLELFETIGIGIHLDSGDLWGSMMTAAFDGCNTLHLRGELDRVPDELEYRPSPMGPSDPDEVVILEFDEVDSDRIVEFLTAIHPLIERGESLGVSY